METQNRTELIEIVGITDETPDVRTLKMRFRDNSGKPGFKFLPGQMAEYSVFGEGEYTLSIASSPTRLEYLECSFRISDKPDSGLKKLRQGDLMALRGPYGNAFPIDRLKNKNIILIAGELGLVSLRSLIWSIIDSREDYKEVTLIYGASQSEEMVYKNELIEWQNMPDLHTKYTAYSTPKNSEWQGERESISEIVKREVLSADNSVAIICGSSDMNESVIHVLTGIGFDENNVYVYLDNKSMALSGFDFPEAGFVSKPSEGPIFTFRQLKKNENFN